MPSESRQVTAEERRMLSESRHYVYLLMASEGRHFESSYIVDIQLCVPAECRHLE